MKKTILFAFMLWLVGLCNLSAQEYKNFDLNQYYTPDIVRNQLDLEFGTSGSIGSNRTTSDSTFSKGISWNVLPSFIMHKNTRKIISVLNLNDKSRGYYRTQSDPNSTDFSSTFLTNNDLSLSYNVQFYNPKKQYLLIGTDATYSGSYYKNHDETNLLKQKYLNKENRNFVNITLGIGSGRIESVEDARQAIYILDELSKKGSLTKTLSNAEIFEFAQQISKIKNKRFLDARLRKIEEITVVDSFLIAHNYLTDQNAAYFTTLYDNWEFGALNVREAGQSFQISIAPVLSLEMQNYEPIDTLYWSDKLNLRYGADLNFTYQYEKPVGLNWQHSLYANLNLNRSLEDNTNTNYSNTETQTTTKSTSGRLNAYYKLSYYPTTRTYYSMRINQSNALQYSDPDYIKSGNFSITSLNLSANYYFSPQLRFSGYVRFENNFQEFKYNDSSLYDNSNNSFSGNFGASLSYSFF